MKKVQSNCSCSCSGTTEDRHKSVLTIPELKTNEQTIFNAHWTDICQKQN